MKATTLLDRISSWLGTPVCAAPLSRCRITRPYLLKRAGIPEEGTAILFAIPYLMCADVKAAERNVSLYAVPRDYHGYVQSLGEWLIPRLKEAVPEGRFSLFADHSPIAEVDAAARAGLGVLGQNGLLITPDYGSFVFLAEICTDLDYASLTGGATVDAFPDKPPLCEGCGACLKACPAMQEGKWVSPCLSELTQKKGDLTVEEINLLRGHPLVWGCDTCQLVCPHNRRTIADGRNTPIPYFRDERITHIGTTDLDNFTDDAFAARAYAWRGKAVIRRNVALFEDEEEQI